MAKPTKTKKLLAALILTAATLIITGIFNYISKKMTYSPIERLENVVIDLGYKARSMNNDFNKVSLDDIIIVDIDNESIEELGRVQWWPRKYDADVISNIAAGSPHSIGVDFLYTESDELPSIYDSLLARRGFEETDAVISALSTDSMLRTAIADAGMVYLSWYDDHYKETDSELNDPICLIDGQCVELSGVNTEKYHSIIHPVLPIPSLVKAAAGTGSIEMPSEKDGVVRKYILFQQMPDTEKLAVNFPFLMWRAAEGRSNSTISLEGNQLVIDGEDRFSINSDGTMWINWLGAEEEIRHISFYKVLQRRIPSEFFTDKYVFLGASASGLSDLKSVPFLDEQLPGVDVHAIAFLNMMNDAPVERLSSFWSILLIGITTFLLIGAFMYLQSYASLGIVAAALVGYFAGYLVWLFPTTGKIFPIASMLIATLVGFILTLVYRYFTEEREKKQIRHAFSRYVSPTVVEKIMKDPDSLRLGGVKRHLTVLFSDIQGFTTYSERLDPQTLVAILNRYLDAMSEPILRRYGTIDKFIGDAIFAIFGAPLDTNEHADQAVLVALEMREKLVLLNKELERDNLPPLQIGIGINTGEMTVGNVGSSKRFDYTAIGDSVNLGSRIEGLTRYYKCDIIISEYTYHDCTKEDYLVRKLSRVKVLGKGKTVIIYELVDFANQREKYEPWLSEWESALEAYVAKDFGRAINHFNRCSSLKPEDPMTYQYLDRCAKFQNDPSAFTDVIELEHK